MPTKSKAYVCLSGTPTVRGYLKVKAANRPKRPQDLSRYFEKVPRVVKPVKPTK